ncbi:hypothetical protein QUB60_00900 [Microcoleus sp. A2-C5]
MRLWEWGRDDVTKALVLWNLAAGRTVTAAAPAETGFWFINES